MARAHKITADAARKARWEQHHAHPDRWFWKRVNQTGGADACWPWLGNVVVARRGYGRLIFRGRSIGAHRMALILASGGNRPEMFACHRCDNPVCCNPAHLFWGTPLENRRDCIAKGRNRPPHPRKIDLEEVVRLRAGGASYSTLAERYSVNQASIGKALQRAAALRARASSTENNNG